MMQSNDSGRPAQIKAESLVLTLLSDKPAPTSADVDAAVQSVVAMLCALDPQLQLDVERLTRDIEAKCNVWVPTSTILVDETDHIEWLPDRRGSIGWRFWDRYERYLREELRWAPATVLRLDQVTDDVLRRLEDPKRSGKWDRRGMVAGQVQSGKTANYIGLICKAADAGYGLIVVLAGLHNSLRAQTQLRIDAGFLGFDTQKRMKFDQMNARIGVGRLQGVPFHHVNALTNSADNGDFNMGAASQAGVIPGGADPVVLVVKKNKSVLTNLIKWSTLVLQQEDPETHRTVVRDVPILVIDDEADSASVNTRAAPVDESGKAVEEYNPAVINGLIRQLLNKFDKSAYVGYTATPFANLYIQSRLRPDKYGEDLFPRSFIISLPTPSNYMGPSEMFGLRHDPTTALEQHLGLPVIREIDDVEGWISDGHKKTWLPGSMPSSLHIALHAFVLACAVRLVRGEERAHNSMLVHVTRFKDVQKLVADQLSEAMIYLARRLRYGDGQASKGLRQELEELYRSDFVPTSAAMTSLTGDLLPPWAAIDAVLHQVASKIEVVIVNGDAHDVLQYSERPNGLWAVVVGGEKLSRGLTLEGLTISYYLRASKMYDTLMQMGRWFGYRPHYADLCRLYTTSKLVAAYREITVANEELRQRFDHMAYLGKTPADFWLGVRHSPDLMVTSHAKMRTGQKVMLSFSDEISETVTFDKDPKVREHNLSQTRSFLERCDVFSARLATENRISWSGVPGVEILAFVEGFTTEVNAKKAQAGSLAKYIANRLADHELTNWTVLLTEGRTDSHLELVQGTMTRLVERNPDNLLKDGGLKDDLNPVVIGRLVSPVDEKYDLTQDEQALALAKTIQAYDLGLTRHAHRPTTPSGLMIRSERPADRGLLLLYPIEAPKGLRRPEVPLMGLAISFPRSARAEPVEYIVNNVYFQQEFAYMDEAEA